MQSLDPKDLAKHYIEATRETFRPYPGSPKYLGLIASKDEPSLAYARATQQRFLETGMAYELKRVKRLDLEAAIEAANLDPSIHGIFIYFPIFGNHKMLIFVIWFISARKWRLAASTGPKNSTPMTLRTNR